MRSKSKEVSLSPSEHQIQAAAFQQIRLLRNSDWRYGNVWANVNGMKFSRGAIHRAYEEGLEPGVLDITVAVQSRLYPGAYIEVKKGTNLPSDHQVRIAVQLMNAGYLVAFCWNTNAIINFLKWYLR